MVSSKVADNSFGQYELEQLVGQDAFRYVYLAYDSERNRHILLSILRDNLGADERASRDYVSRALALSRIRHPNIATIFDAGVTPDNLPYVASEQIEGFTLADRLSQLAQQKSPAHVIYALTLIRQIASGLSLVERLEYFHYELTPQHIFLRNMTLKADDSAVLVDLDIATDFHREESLGDTSYAAGYLSPEQLNNKKVDGRSHVYSLGIILFQLLSGALPHNAKQKWTQAFRSLSGNGYALQKLRTDLAPETYALIDKSIRTRPGSRYRSLAELVDGIDQAIVAEDLQIHTHGLAEPRRPRPIYLAPLLLLFICIMLAATTWWISVGNTASSAAIVAGIGSPSPMSTSLVSGESSPSPTIVLFAIEETATLGTANSVVDNPVIDLTVVPSRVPSKLQSIATASATATYGLTREAEQTATPTVLISATALPTATPQLPTPRPTYRISVSSASLRQGPGIQYVVDGYLFESEEVEIIAKNNSSEIWYLVKTADDRLGWISSSVGEPVGLTNLVNVAAATTIPAPPPTLTLSPTATPIPTDTVPPPSNNNDGENDNDDENEKPKPKSTPTPPL